VPVAGTLVDAGAVLEADERFFTCVRSEARVADSSHEPDAVAGCLFMIGAR
jgi:hypothetical protein